MKKNVAFAALVLCLGYLCVPAVADTLTLKSTTGGSVNNVDVYPYNFSINGSAALTSLMCLDFNREIQVGETWQVTVSSLLLDDSTTSIDYRALALIDYALQTGYGGYSNADLQFAAWSIFDPAITSNSGYTQNSASIVQQALNQAGLDSFTNSGFYSAFDLYSPTSDQTGWTNGIPQEFIGDPPPPSPAPEPSSLILLGTGMMGIAGFMRRKLAKPVVA